MLSVADALLQPRESAFCPVPRSSQIQIDFMIPHGEVSLVRRSKQHHNIIVVKKILNLVWTNQNYKVKLKQFTAVKSNLVYKCKSACVLCSVWSPVVEIRGENVSALMINAPIRLPIYPSVHPSPPPTLHPPGTPCLDSSTTQGPRQRGPWPPLPAQKWIILPFTPVSAQKPCCTLLRRKKFPRGGNGGSPSSATSAYTSG